MSQNSNAGAQARSPECLVDDLVTLTSLSGHARKKTEKLLGNDSDKTSESAIQILITGSNEQSGSDPHMAYNPLVFEICGNPLFSRLTRPFPWRGIEKETFYHCRRSNLKFERQANEPLAIRREWCVLKCYRGSTFAYYRENGIDLANAITFSSRAFFVVPWRCKLRCGSGCPGIRRRKLSAAGDWWHKAFAGGFRNCLRLRACRSGHYR